MTFFITPADDIFIFVRCHFQNIVPDIDDDILWGRCDIFRRHYFDDIITKYYADYFVDGHFISADDISLRHFSDIFDADVLRGFIIVSRRWHWWLRFISMINIFIIISRLLFRWVSGWCGIFAISTLRLLLS